MTKLLFPNCVRVQLHLGELAQHNHDFDQSAELGRFRDIVSCARTWVASIEYSTKFGSSRVSLAKFCKVWCLTGLRGDRPAIQNKGRSDHWPAMGTQGPDSDADWQFGL